jgi:hypothetical protein
MLPNGTYTLEAASRASAMTGSLTITVHVAALAGPRMTMIPNRLIRINVKEEFTSPDHTGSGLRSSGGRTFSPRGPRRYLEVALELADDFGQNQAGSLRPPSGPQDDLLVIDRVQPGRYWVRINSSRGYASSVTSGGIDLQHEPLAVGLGGTSSPLELTMRDDSAQIEGTIEGAPSTSLLSHLPFAYVYCVPLPDSIGQFAELAVSPEGKFASQGLSPGVYRLLAFKRPPAELEYRNPEAMRAYDEKGQVVSVVANQKEYLRLQLVTSE